MIFKINKKYTGIIYKDTNNNKKKISIDVKKEK